MPTARELLEEVDALMRRNRAGHAGPVVPAPPSHPAPSVPGPDTESALADTHAEDLSTVDALHTDTADLGVAGEDAARGEDTVADSVASGLADLDDDIPVLTDIAGADGGARSDAEDGLPATTALDDAVDDFPLLTEAIGNVEMIEPQRMADGTQAWTDGMPLHADVAAPVSEPAVQSLDEQPAGRDDEATADDSFQFDEAALDATLAAAPAADRPDADSPAASQAADDAGEFALAAVEEGASPAAESEQLHDGETDLAEWLREQAAAHAQAYAVPDSAAPAASAVANAPAAAQDIAWQNASPPDAHAVATGFGATPPSQAVAFRVDVAPAVQAPLAADDPRWAALAEEIRVQVLQRVDLFTEAGLQSQLQQHLQPIVDRASAELVATINRQVGQLLRAYVAEAIEREIEKWRSDTR